VSLNESQLRRILTTFGYVDDLLRSVEALAHPDPSPFTHERPDLTPDEARLLVSFVSGARARMVAALDRLGIPRPEQNLSARRSVGTALLFGEISLSELDAKSLRGYGGVDPKEAAEVQAVAADLQALMRRGIDLLREQEAGGLAERVARLGGPAGTILRRVLEISTERGLAEVRPLVAAAAERVEGTTFDVGVFGRVSSGKSSLINALVGGRALPVGATPVTAVPVRIRRGEPAVEVRFRDRRTEAVPLADLATYATEEHNPHNQRGVVSIEVAFASAPEGLRFLDTPGVGSLAASGSAQAFAWLPRCDFGLVLVAAGTPLGRDETALVSGLRHAGIDCRVLLSKADLLDGEETERTRAYVQSELLPLIGAGRSVEILPISTRPGHLEGLRRFRGQVLETLAADHVRSANQALNARLRRLITVTSAALDGGRGTETSGSESVDLEKRRSEAAKEIGSATDRLAGSAGEVLATAGAAVAEAWACGADGAMAARTAIQRAAARALTAVREAVEAARTGAGAESGPATRRVPPLFDPELLDAIRDLAPPRFLPVFLRAAAAGRAVAPLLPHLDQALHRFAARLYSWGAGALNEIQPPAEASPVHAVQNAELAALEPLLDDLAEPARGDASVPAR
jgi:GTP-binding protein EngB required for normal cell division